MEPVDDASGAIYDVPSQRAAPPSAEFDLSSEPQPGAQVAPDEPLRPTSAAPPGAAPDGVSSPHRQRRWLVAAALVAGAMLVLFGSLIVLRLVDHGRVRVAARGGVAPGTGEVGSDGEAGSIAPAPPDGQSLPSVPTIGEAGAIGPGDPIGGAGGATTLPDGITPSPSTVETSAPLVTSVAPTTLRSDATSTSASSSTASSAPSSSTSSTVRASTTTTTLPSAVGPTGTTFAGASGADQHVGSGCAALVSTSETKVACARGSGLIILVVAPKATPAARIARIYVPAAAANGSAHLSLSQSNQSMAIGAVTDVSLGSSGNVVVIGLHDAGGGMAVDVISLDGTAANVVAHLDRTPNAAANASAANVQTWRNATAPYAHDVLQYDHGAYRLVTQDAAATKPTTNL